MTPRTRPMHKTAPALLVLLLLLFSVLPQSVWATEQQVPEDTIELTGTLSGTFELNSSDMELFALKRMVPGDSWSGKINVVNKTGTDMEISLISIASNLEDLTLFNALDLTILVEGEPVYEGSYGATADPITPKMTVSKDKPLTFDITVSLPATAGNEIRAKQMDSTWVFEANCEEPEKIQTGIDLTVGNSGSATWLLVSGACLIASFIILWRVSASRREEDRA